MQNNPRRLNLVTHTRVCSILHGNELTTTTLLTTSFQALTTVLFRTFSSSGHSSSSSRLAMILSTRLPSGFKIEYIFEETGIGAWLRLTSVDPA